MVKEQAGDSCLCFRSRYKLKKEDRYINFFFSHIIKLRVILLYYTLRLVCKICASFSTNENQTKTNRGSLARVFPHLASVTCYASDSDWFIALLTSVVIGKTNYLSFGFTSQSKTALIWMIWTAILLSVSAESNGTM